MQIRDGLADGRVALHIKVHHSMVDGVSDNEILGVLLDPSREAREIPPAPEEPHGERVPGELEMLGRGVLGLPRQRTSGSSRTATRSTTCGR